MIGLILLGVVVVLGLNLNLSDSGKAPSGVNPAVAPTGGLKPLESTAPSGARPAGFREHQIGDDVERNGMRIGAVWLAMVQMAGDPTSAADAANRVHLEADVHAAEGNPNGFPRDEFVPYLPVTYTIAAIGDSPTAQGVEPMHGELMPMVARDGWHYGATILMPGPGRYRLTYHFEPPAAGRHSDAATGVAPWWAPFDVSFDWDFKGANSS